MDEPRFRRRAASEAEQPLASTTATVAAPVERQELRPAMREEDPRTRAARRAAELRDHGAVDEDGTDEFYIPAAEIPPGWSYEWKRRQVLGADDPAYQVSIARQGWEAVPVSRHPTMMPPDWRGNTIERKGLVLMERPLEITQDARERELIRARQQVRAKEQQLSSADGGQFERTNKGDSLVKVRKSYESIPIPE